VLLAQGSFDTHSSGRTNVHALAANDAIILVEEIGLFLLLIKIDGENRANFRAFFTSYTGLLIQGETYIQHRTLLLIWHLIG
jgi:hypothetical protein